jgi:hypothetical protein
MIMNLALYKIQRNPTHNEAKCNQENMGNEISLHEYISKWGLGKSQTEKQQNNKN